MNMVETIAVVSIWFMMVAWTGQQEVQRYQELDRAPVADVVGSLVEGLEGYAESEYGALWRCTDADSLADGGVTREVDVPVYATVGVAATMGLGQYVDAASTVQDSDCVAGGGVDRDRDGIVDLGDGDNFPLSVEEAGFLPFALRDLGYGPGANEFWSRMGLRFRVVARFVDANPVTGEITRDLQMFLAVAPELDEMELADALGILRAAGSARLALGEGRTPPLIVERVFRGFGGGWEIQVQAAAASLDNSPLLANRMVSPVGVPATYPTGLELMGESGEGRVVGGVSLAETQLLSQALYRADIGVAGANRMETDIDLGGFGAVQTSYVVGVDEDGDGVVDWPIAVVGAPPGSDLPVTVDGDLHVTGSLTVGHGVRIAGQGASGDPLYYGDMDTFVGRLPGVGGTGPWLQVAGDAHFQNSVAVGGRVRVAGLDAPVGAPAGGPYANIDGVPVVPGAPNLLAFVDHTSNDPALQVGGRAHFSDMVTGTGGLRVVGASRPDDDAGILLVGNRVLIAGDAGASPPAAGTPNSLFSGRAAVLTAAEFAAEPSGNVTGAFADGDVGIRGTGNGEIWMDGDLDIAVGGDRQADVQGNDFYNVGLDRQGRITGLRDVVVGQTDLLDIGSDRTLIVGGARDVEINGGDDELYVNQNRIVVIDGARDVDINGGNDELTVSADRIVEIGGMRDVDVNGGNDELTVSADRLVEIGGMRDVDVNGGNDELYVSADRIVEIGGARDVDVGGEDTLDVVLGRTVTIGGDLDENVTGFIERDAGGHYHVVAGADWSMEAQEGVVNMTSGDLDVDASTDITIDSGTSDVIVTTDAGFLRIDEARTRLRGAGGRFGYGGGDRGMSSGMPRFVHESLGYANRRGGSESGGGTVPTCRDGASPLAMIVPTGWGRTAYVYESLDVPVEMEYNLEVGGSTFNAVGQGVSRIYVAKPMIGWSQHMQTGVDNTTGAAGSPQTNYIKVHVCNYG